jgi:bis(5'-adenosyl)-triphosphatase
MISAAVAWRSTSALFHTRTCFVASFSSSSLSQRDRKSANACPPRSRLFSSSASLINTMPDNNNNSNAATNDNNDNTEDAYFGKFVIPAASIFYRSPGTLSTAFVNLRPIVPGHVLVMSARSVARIEDLTDEEHDDLWRSVRVVQGILKQQYSEKATATDADKTTSTSLLSFNVAVQDGRAAGQSVPHVHVHILPRSSGDFARNDDIYQELEEWAPRAPVANTADAAVEDTAKLDVPDDDQRRDRTREEMAQEAAMYREILCTTASKE